MPNYMSRDVVLPLNHLSHIGEAVSFALTAEELGYGHVTAGETTGHNVPLVLGLIASRTEKIGLCDDALSPFSRSPALLGQTCVTMQEISDGRFRLRLGASSPALAEGWHGVDFDRPLRRVRESIEIIRQIQSGDRVEYNGRIYAPSGLKLGVSPPEVPAPVDVAALGPKSTEMTGRYGDGWVPQLLPIDGLKDRLQDLRRGAELGNRDVDEVRVSLMLRCCAIEDRDRARELARSQLAFMIALYGPYYRRAIANAGWSDLTDEVHDKWHEGDREGSVNEITDELLDELVVAGTPDDALAQIERFEDINGVDSTQLAFFGGMNQKERIQTMEVLAPVG